LDQYLLTGYLLLFYYLNYLVSLRSKGEGFDYVFVENDGTLRGVDDLDQEFLSQEFHPNDRARPYIKNK